jgi:hypothetical protein
MGYVYDDGGRAAAGYKGKSGDCVVRAIAIASGQPYEEVYFVLSAGMSGQRSTKRSKRKPSARDGVTTGRAWFKRYMASLGAVWTPTMKVGQGCRVHLTAEELPAGRLVVAVSRHYTAMIDGVIRDTHDPRRETHMIEPDTGRELKPGEWRNVNGICHIARRCVYGYWTFP